MSETSSTPTNSPVGTRYSPAEGKLAKLVYLLFLFALVLSWTVLVISLIDPATAVALNNIGTIASLLVEIVGVVIAYMQSGLGPQWVEGHYRFQIRTFWISCLLMVLFIILTALSTATQSGLIGLAALAFFAYFTWWWIARCLNGYKAVTRGLEHPNPTTWAFGK
jgi:uncharacterized membrane protein